MINRYSYTMMDTVPAKDPFIAMQDDVKLVWEHLPHSQRLAFFILARGEFGQLNDVSYHMAKAWKEERASDGRIA